jgi:flagellar biogenesis protein FliO
MHKNMKKVKHFRIVLSICLFGHLAIHSDEITAPTPPTHHTVHFTSAGEISPSTPSNHPLATPYDSSLPSEISSPRSQPDDDQFYSQFLSMLSTLGIVVAVILFITWVLKQLLSTRIQQMNSSSAIKILERRSLTPKTAIYLLDVYGKGIAIAESQNGVTRLSEFSIVDSTPIPASNSSSFDKTYMSNEAKEDKP